MERLHKQGWRQAIASSAPRANVDAVLDALHLRAWFQAIVSAEDVRTTQFSIDPQYNTTQGVTTLRGYQVTNVLTVRIRKIADTGKVVDDATAAAP